MAWKAVHPDLTEKVRLPADGPEFELQFWPPLEAERINALTSNLRKPSRKDEKEIDAFENPDELVKRAGYSYELIRDMARYGVRSWSGFGDIPCATETVEIDGKKHVRLTAESLAVLHANKLLVAVALKAQLMNILSEDQKKTSGWLSSSDSSTSPTDAADVTPSESPKTTE